MEMSKGVKIGISIMAVIIILLVIYYAFFSNGTTKESTSEASKLGPASGGREPYYSAEVYGQIMDNAYPKYATLSTDGVNALWQTMKSIYGDSVTTDKVGNSVRKDMAILGWFKGMNLAANGNYLYYFKNDIEMYLNSSVVKSSDDIKVGGFIK